VQRMPLLNDLSFVTHLKIPLPFSVIKLLIYVMRSVLCDHVNDVWVVDSRARTAPPREGNRDDRSSQQW
jgi:hypothetical protein